MTKSLEQEILDNAPNNTWAGYSEDSHIYATPLDNGNYLFKTSGATKSWVGNKLGFTRSRSDIEKIIALQNENAEKDKRIAELEKQLKLAEKAWIEMGGLPFRFNTKGNAE